MPRQRFLFGVRTRVHGDTIHGYIVNSENDDKEEIATIKVGAAAASPLVWDKFMDVLKATLEAFIGKAYEQLGKEKPTDPIWVEEKMHDRN